MLVKLYILFEKQYFMSIMYHSTCTFWSYPADEWTTNSLCFKHRCEYKFWVSRAQGHFFLESEVVYLCCFVLGGCNDVLAVGVLQKWPLWQGTRDCPCWIQLVPASSSHHCNRFTTGQWACQKKKQDKTLRSSERERNEGKKTWETALQTPRFSSYFLFLSC